VGRFDSYAAPLGNPDPEKLPDAFGDADAPTKPVLRICEAARRRCDEPRGSATDDPQIR
jgi:hypothetical protein